MGEVPRLWRVALGFLLAPAATLLADVGGELVVAGLQDLDGMHPGYSAFRLVLDGLPRDAPW